MARKAKTKRSAKAKGKAKSKSKAKAKKRVPVAAEALLVALRAEIGVPPEKARDQGEEESRRQASAQAHGGEAEEAAGGAQGRAESRAGPTTGSCAGRTGAQPGACARSDDRRLLAGPVGWPDGMNDRL